MNFIDKRIRVCIIDEDVTFRAMAELLINSNEHYNVVRSSSYWESDEDLKSQEIDLLVIDVSKHSVNDPKRLLALKNGSRSGVMVLALTSRVDNSLFDFLKLGLVGLLNKTSVDFQYNLVSSLDNIIKNQFSMCNKISKLIVESFHQNPDCPLTDREREIIVGASKGMTYSLISQKMNVSIETVKSHFRNIYIKLGVNTKYAAISMATNNSWV